MKKILFILFLLPVMVFAQTAPPPPAPAPPSPQEDFGTTQNSIVGAQSRSFGGGSIIKPSQILNSADFAMVGSPTYETFTFRPGTSLSWSNINLGKGFGANAVITFDLSQQAYSFYYRHKSWYYHVNFGRMAMALNSGASVTRVWEPKKIKKNLHLSLSDVAVFASWEGMKNSVAKDSEQILEVIFPEIRNDNYLSPEILLLQKNAMIDLPTWKESRKDKYTFEMALQYLKNKCPRLLYISLVDSDENGHLNDYPGYVKTLRTYDQYLGQIIKTLKSMGQYGMETTLFVTTDHSRGDAEKWINHGSEESDKNVFLYARGRGVRPQGKLAASATHAQIGPTIEYLMGLSPIGEVLPGFR